MYNRVGELEQNLIGEGEINSSLTVTIGSLENAVEVLEEEINSISMEKENLVKENKKLKEDISTKEKENSKLSDENKTLRDKELSQSESAANEPVTTSENKSETSADSSWKSMTVNASAYTLVEHGDVMGGTGLTSTGKVPTANRTIAVDPSVIPYGSLIQYNGVTYVAEDTGGIIIGNMVDIYMDTLSEAVTFGRKDIEILVQTP